MGLQFPKEAHSNEGQGCCFVVVVVVVVVSLSFLSLLFLITELDEKSGVTCSLNNECSSLYRTCTHILIRLFTNKLLDEKSPESVTLCELTVKISGWSVFTAT